MRFATCKFRSTSWRTRIAEPHSSAVLGLLLLLICVAGCGNPSGKASVHGTVSYRGTPLESASIAFFPTKGRQEVATISHGEYSVNLIPGEYTAIILIGVDLPKGFKEGDPIPPPRIVLPENYTTQAKSSLKATVVAGKNEPINFDLK